MIIHTYDTGIFWCAHEESYYPYMSTKEPNHERYKPYSVVQQEQCVHNVAKQQARGSI